MNLLRTAFWLSIVIVLLPTGRGDQTQSTTEKVSIDQAVTAASATASDMAGFCDRNPAVCATGKSAAVAFADKAKFGATMVYEWAVGNETSPSDTAVDKIGDQADAQSVIEGKADYSEKSDLIKPNKPAKRTQNTRPRASQNTLSREDMAPAWKGPRNKAA